MRDKMESTPSSRFDPKAVEVPVRIGGVLLETGARDFSVRVGKDIVVEPSRGEPCRFTLAFADTDTAVQMFAAETVNSVASAYVDGTMEIEGDMEAAIDLIERLFPDGARDGAHAPARARADGSSLEHVRDEVNYHYELPI